MQGSVLCRLPVRSLVVVTFIIAFWLGTPSSLAVEYDIIDLGFLPGGTDSWAESVNNHGQVVGRGGNHAFLWTNKTGMIDLQPFIGRTSSEGVDINDAGEIVGDFWNPNEASQGFLYKYPESNVVLLQPLDPNDPRYPGTSAEDISETGVIGGWAKVGTATAVPGCTVVCSLDDQGGHTCGPCSGFGANSTNVHGMRVGSTSEPRAFVQRDGETIYLPALSNAPFDPVDGPFSMGRGINDLGWAVGWADSGAHTPRHAVLWIPRSPTPTPAIADSVPADCLIDPRGESGGIDAVTFVFDQAVFNLDGSPLGVEGFQVAATDNPAIQGAPVVPVPIAVDATNNPTVVVTLSRPIPAGEWTTITARVASASGFESFQRIQIGRLPCDINRDGEVGLSDASAFVNEWNGSRDPALIDMNRDGEVGLADVSAFVGLLNGVGGNPGWLGMSLP
jgi:probable HAF family extracellular repeat protein